MLTGKDPTAEMLVDLTAVDRTQLIHESFSGHQTSPRTQLHTPLMTLRARAQTSAQQGTLLGDDRPKLQYFCKIHEARAAQAIIPEQCGRICSEPN